MLDVLGDVLYWPHADYIDVRGNAYSNNKPLKDFPSPDELMGAVLLTKPPSHLEVDVSKGTIEQGDDDQLHVHKGADDDDAAWGPEVPVSVPLLSMHATTYSLRFHQRNIISNCDLP